MTLLPLCSNIINLLFHLTSTFIFTGKCGVLDLGKAERFCMALIRIPRYQERIRCFMYVLRFQEIIKDLNADLLIVHNACERVIQSDALGRALEVLVALGNFLNLYSVNGEADGVMVDSLNKLKQVKSYGSQTTALHYFTLVVQDRCKNVFNLSSEVGDCRGASGVVVSALTAEMNILRKGYVSLTNELKATSKIIQTEQNIAVKVLENENMKDISTYSTLDMNNSFLKSLDLFLKNADIEITVIEKMNENLGLKYNKVKEYYGEFENTQPEQFFSSLANFIVDFEQARRDNEDSRARSKKKKANKKKQDAKDAKKKKRNEERTNRKKLMNNGKIDVLKHSSGRRPPSKANTPPALKGNQMKTMMM